MGRAYCAAFWTYVGFPEGTADVEGKIAALGDFATNFAYAPTQFALMLAKIAHAAAVAHRGLGSFSPLLNRLIVERSTDIHDYVGGAVDYLPLERNSVFHITIRTGREYLTAELCPFAHLGAPVYEVVVGRPLPVIAG